MHILFGISTFRCLTKHSKRVKQKTFSPPTEKMVKKNKTHSTFTYKLTKFLTSSGRGFTVQFETDHGINTLIIFCHFTIIGKVFSFFSSVYLAIDNQFIKIKEGFLLILLGLFKHWIKFSMNFFNFFREIV